MQNWRDPSFFRTSTTPFHQGDWLGWIAPASSMSLSDSWTSSSKVGVCAGNILWKVYCHWGESHVRWCWYTQAHQIQAQATHSGHWGSVYPLISPATLAQTVILLALAHLHLVLRVLPLEAPTSLIWHVPHATLLRKIALSIMFAPLSKLACYQLGAWWTHAALVVWGVVSVLSLIPHQHAW